MKDRRVITEWYIIDHSHSRAYPAFAMPSYLLYRRVRRYSVWGLRKLTSTLFPLIFLGSAAFAQSEAIQKARDDLKSGDFEQAAHELTIELQRNPRSPEAHILLAYAEQETNRLEDAVREYQRALSLDPKSFPAHFNLALLCMRRKDSATAIRELQRAVALEPQNADAQYDLAVLALDAGRPSEALIHLDRAKDLQPTRRDIQFQRIRAYLAARRFAQAEQEAHSFLSGHVEETAAVAQTFLSAGHPAEAVPYLQQALRSASNKDDVRSLLAEAWLSMRKPEDVLALIPDPRTANDHYLRGQALFDMRQLQAAVAESDRAIELETSNPRFLLLAARLYQRLGNPQAEPLLDRAITLAPDWYEPYYSRSVSFYFQHNYDAAAASVQKAVSLNQQCAPCAFLYGVIRFNQGEMTQSETAFRRAVLLDPENSRFRTHLAALLMRSGRKVQAKAELSRAIQLSPNYGLPHYELGKLLAGTSHFEEAATQLEEARRLDPHLTEALYQLGQVYFKLGNPSRAEQALKEFREAKVKQEERASLNEDFDVALTR